MSIRIPIYVWLPALTWLVTYLLTKYGLRGFIKKFFDFDM